MSIRFGTLGEFFALDYLTISHGYILLCWNYVFKQSQQDLVFLHSKENKLIFVEVKTSTASNYLAEIGSTLTYAKLNKRKLAAEEFCKLFNLKMFSNYEICFGLIKIQTKTIPRLFDQELAAHNVLIEYLEEINL